VIEEMKDIGAPIDYSRKAESYYYIKAFEMSISCTFRRLSPLEQQDVSAGCQLYSHYCFHAVSQPKLAVNFS
jgi:hypothetical protein